MLAQNQTGEDLSASSGKGLATDKVGVFEIEYY